MKDLPPEMVDEIQKVLHALQQDLKLDPLRVVVLKGSLRATIEGDALVVPSSYADHWRRFGLMPTALVRDAAYAAKKRSLKGSGLKPSAIEADAMAYSEHFLRAVVEAAED